MAKTMKTSHFLVFILIPLVPLLVWWFGPMILAFLMSFTDGNYINTNYEIVAFYNYQTLLTNDQFYQALWNTLYYSIAYTIPTIVIGFIIGLLVYKQNWGSSWFKGFLFAPWVTPMVSSAIVWSYMFQPRGMINSILNIFGIQGPSWLSDSNFAMIAVVAVAVWGSSGWAMLFYNSAFEQISSTYEEVADLEGANIFQKIRYIYIPGSIGTTIFLFITSLITSIQVYDSIQVMTQGGPAGSTRTLLYYYYQSAFEQFNMGQASAVAMIMLGITAVIILLFTRLQKHYS